MDDRHKNDKESGEPSSTEQDISQHVCFDDHCKPFDGPSTPPPAHLEQGHGSILAKRAASLNEHGDQSDYELEPAATKEEESETFKSTSSSSNHDDGAAVTASTTSLHPRSPPRIRGSSTRNSSFASTSSPQRSVASFSSFNKRRGQQQQSMRSRSASIVSSIVQPPWTDWSEERKKWTALGCISSCAVLAIRLWLDMEPLAYLIHSIIVFLDVILIHFFTHSPWLSVSVEIVTVAFVVAFTLTKETIYELLETTCIAALCSFHMISARNVHMEREKELTEGVDQLRRQTMVLLQEEERSQASLRSIHLQTSILLKDMEILEGDFLDVLSTDEDDDEDYNHDEEAPQQQVNRRSNNRRRTVTETLSADFGEEHDVKAIITSSGDHNHHHNSDQNSAVNTQYDDDMAATAAAIGSTRRSASASANVDKNHNKNNGDEEDEDDQYSSSSIQNKLRRSANWAVSSLRQRVRQRVQICGHNFFEHFLDGSAGVLYTSFFGLILDEIIRTLQGVDKCDKE